jgi:hypothetical protein
VYGHLIRKGDHSQVTTVQLRDGSPESMTIHALRFVAEGMCDNADAPLTLQIGALPKHDCFEVLCELVPLHAMTIACKSHDA